MIFNIKQLGVYAQQYPQRFDIFRHLTGVTLWGKISVMFSASPILSILHPKIGSKRKPCGPCLISGHRTWIYPEEIPEALGRMASPDFIPGEVIWESKNMPNENEKL